jgi:integrase
VKKSANLPKGIDQLGPNRYRVRLYFQGKQHTIGIFRTIGDAKAAQSIALSEKARGIFVPPATRRAQHKAQQQIEQQQTERDSRTVNELADAWLTWLDRMGRKYNTRYQYYRTIEAYLLPTFDERPVTSITPDDIATWFDQLLLDKGEKVARPAYATISTMFNYATGQAQGLPRSFEPWIESNPCDVPGASRKPRPDKSQQAVATPAEIADIAANMPDGEQLIVLLAGWCGFRLGEVLAFRRRHVTTSTQDGHQVMWIEVEKQVQSRGSGVREETPKSSAGERAVPVPSALQPVVADHLKTIDKHPDTLLFPRQDTGNQLHNPNTVRKRFNKARDAAIAADKSRRARLAGFTFHGLRHSCLTRIGQAGATLADLMAYAGHSDVDSVLIYQHSEKQRLAALAEQLSPTIQ